MQAIRKVTKIKNNTLKLVDLEELNNQTVEVIILSSNIKKSSIKVKKGGFFKLKGIWKDRDINLKKLRSEIWRDKRL